MTVGCGGEETYQLAAVTGTVKFPDGSVPKGDIATVRFIPQGIEKKGAFDPNPASGAIQPDGSFQLTTGSEIGAIVGTHKVVITIIPKYPADPKLSPPVVHPSFSEVGTTPLQVEVKPGANSIPIEVKKP
ncbi:MAG: hypothetical protein O3A00_13845 [Planctomycetota bacterium]|nr:hypothetical protein [Planctomycetota bacterium]